MSAEDAAYLAAATTATATVSGATADGDAKSQPKKKTAAAGMKIKTRGKDAKTAEVATRIESRVALEHNIHSINLKSEWKVDLSRELPTPIVVKPIALPGKNAGRFCVQLFNVLSPAECKKLIAQTESVGYAKLKNYPASYRNNTRLMVQDVQSADWVYERVKSHLPVSIADKARFSRFNTVDADDGSGDAKTKEPAKWVPFALNEQWRFCRYEPPQHFSSHFDASFSRSDKECSKLTFMLYLNDAEAGSGGCTNFLASAWKNHSAEESQTPASNIIAAIPPAAGMALVFEHDILHEGARLLKGVKYLMRSDVMFRYTAAAAAATATAATAAAAVPIASAGTANASSKQ